jgi:hypothetical protein
MRWYRLRLKSRRHGHESQRSRTASIRVPHSCIPRDGSLCTRHPSASCGYFHVCMCVCMYTRRLPHSCIPRDSSLRTRHPSASCGYFHMCVYIYVCVCMYTRRVYPGTEPCALGIPLHRVGTFICVYVCMYVCVYTCMCLGISAVHGSLCTRYPSAPCGYVYMCVYMCVCMYVHTFVNMCVHMCVLGMRYCVHGSSCTGHPSAIFMHVCICAIFMHVCMCAIFMHVCMCAWG